MVGFTDDSVLESFRKMVLIRALEEAICREYANRNIRGPVHLSIGQEAMAVGVSTIARDDDVAVSTHRDHAHYLAKGGSLSACIDELYGLETGCSRGFGGSMHMFSRQVNFLGASAVLPGSMPISVGLGLACKLNGTDAICVGYTGDGASDEGSFYEALNLASVLGSHVLFVCENNRLSTNTSIIDRQAQPDLVSKARAFGLDSEEADGVDVFNVAAAAASLAEKARSGHPAMLVLTGDRLCSHVGPISSVPPLDFAGLIDVSKDTATRDPIARCLHLITVTRPWLLDECRHLLLAVLDLIAAEFNRADSAFRQRNTLMGIAAPPPPKSHVV